MNDLKPNRTSTPFVESHRLDSNALYADNPFLPTTPFPGCFSLQRRTDRALRVDLAGEKGAITIYNGQITALGCDHPFIPVISEMMEQEKQHVLAFESLAETYHFRPSLLAFFWHLSGLTLGFCTGFLGGKAAMACTAAVEGIINEHYGEQVRFFTEKDVPLATFLEKCRQEECAHHDTSVSHGAHDAPYILQLAIRIGTRCAIIIAERL